MKRREEPFGKNWEQSGITPGTVHLLLVLKLTSVKTPPLDTLTPTGEFPLHLHVEVPSLETNRERFPSIHRTNFQQMFTGFGMAGLVLPV